MKRTLRFVIVVALLFGLMAVGQSAMTGACDSVAWPHAVDCPN